MQGSNSITQLYFRFAERLYGGLAKAYDPVTWAASLGQWHSWRKAALAHIIGARVLEIGFGTGEILTELACLGLTVYGLERSPSMHRITAAKLHRRKLSNIHRVQGIAQQLPFAAESFDTVVTTFPAPYLRSHATLSEVARVLHAPDALNHSPGGRLVVVGLGIYNDGRPLGKLMRALRGVAVEQMLEEYERLARAVNLDVRVIRSELTFISMPIVVSERLG